MYHTVAIGGGCFWEQPQQYPSKENSIKRGILGKVCLIEKAVPRQLSRHSGIVRSANADPDASIMASISSNMEKFKTSLGS